MIERKKKMKLSRNIFTLAIAFMMSLMLILPAYAATADAEQPAAGTEAALEAEEEASGSIVLSDTGAKSIAAAVAIGLGALGGTIAMGLAAGKASESMARQPEIRSDIRTTLMLGLVFIETAIIYALLVVILIIFVL